MARYLDNNVVTVDAVLTKLGREKLSEGGQQFRIVKFSLSDDEIDYGTWDPANSNGTSYYGQAIENMSLIEANPNETKTMRHHLITLSKNSQRLPTIAVVGGTTSYTIESNITSPLILQMETFNSSGGNSTLGYTATISDGSILQIEGTGQVNVGGGTSFQTQIGSQTNVANKTVTATGTAFEIRPIAQYNENKTAQVMITGNETGGYIIVTITVKKVTVNVPGGGGGL